MKTAGGDAAMTLSPGCQVWQLPTQPAPAIGRATRAVRRPLLCILCLPQAYKITVYGIPSASMAATATASYLATR